MQLLAMILPPVQHLLLTQTILFTPQPCIITTKERVTRLFNASFIETQLKHNHMYIFEATTKCTILKTLQDSQPYLECNPIWCGCYYWHCVLWYICCLQWSYCCPVLYWLWFLGLQYLWNQIKNLSLYRIMFMNIVPPLNWLVTVPKLIWKGARHPLVCPLYGSWQSHPQSTTSKPILALLPDYQDHS